MGHYFKFDKKKSFSCINKITLKDIYIALYSSDKTMFSAVAECYNQNRNDGEKIVINNFDEKQKKSKKNQIDSHFNDLSEQILSFKYNKELAYNLLKNLKAYNNITARLLEAYLYFISGNSARSEFIILQMTKKDFTEHSFNSDIRELTYSEQKDKIFHLLEIFKNEQFQPEVLNNLMYYLSYGATGSFSDELVKKFSINENLTSLRKKYRSAVYGKFYPYIWSKVLLKNSSINEYSKFLNSSNIEELLESNTVSSLLFFIPLDSIDKPYQSLVLKNFNLLKERTDLYSQEILFNLLEDDHFLKFISVHSSFKMGLLVNSKRNAYSTALKIPSFYEYALFKLVSIGDIRLHEIQNLIKEKGF